MSIFNLFRSRDKPLKDKPSGRFGGWSIFGSSASGTTVNERTAMQITAVYACVRVLSESLACLPLRVYRSDGRGKAVAVAHPSHRLLFKAPNPEMTSFVFRETLMSHILLYGNAYAQIIRDGRGYPVELYPLAPDKMTVDRNKDNGELVYIYRGSEGGERSLRRWDVLHIPGLSFDGIVGYSPIAVAKQAIGSALAVEEYGSKFFANGASPGGVLEFPGTVKDIKRVKESWNAGHQGTANAGKVAVLEEGAKFSAISISPEQAQFLEVRKFSTSEICRIFRVPPHLIADLERATFSNIEHQSLEFVKFSLVPWLERWEQCLEQSLLMPSEQDSHYIKFCVDGLLRGAYKERMDGYSTGIQNGIFSPNEVRELEDMNPIDNPAADKVYFNGNMLPIELAGRQYVDKEEMEGNET